MAKSITVTETCGMSGRQTGFGSVRDADVPAKLKKRTDYNPRLAVFCFGCNQVLLLDKEGLLPRHKHTLTVTPR